MAIKTKTISYPKGSETVFLDGRILREVQEFELRGTFPCPGIPPNPFIFLTGEVPMFITPRGRAAYIKNLTFDFGGIDPLFQPVNVGFYQIWADGVKIVDRCDIDDEQNINIYIPPITRVSIYVRLENRGVQLSWLRGTIPWITFDATQDIWEWGTGRQANNPANGDW